MAKTVAEHLPLTTRCTAKMSKAPSGAFQTALYGPFFILKEPLIEAFLLRDRVQAFYEHMFQMGNKLVIGECR
jgi:hypothetical protein